MRSAKPLRTTIAVAREDSSFDKSLASPKCFQKCSSVQTTYFICPIISADIEPKGATYSSNFKQTTTLPAKRSPQTMFSAIFLVLERQNHRFCFAAAFHLYADCVQS